MKGGENVEVEFKFTKLSDDLTPSQLYELLAGELRKRWETVEAMPFGASFKEGTDEDGDYVWYDTCLLNAWIVRLKDDQVFLRFGGSREAFFARTPFHNPNGVQLIIEWDHVEVYKPTSPGILTWLADGEVVLYETTTPPEWGVLFSERIRPLEEEPDKAVILNHRGYPRRIVPYDKNHPYRLS
jgi:hypothetical protein